jgi:hypothetical protein
MFDWLALTVKTHLATGLQLLTVFALWRIANRLWEIRSDFTVLNHVLHDKLSPLAKIDSNNEAALEDRTQVMAATPIMEAKSGQINGRVQKAS